MVELGRRLVLKGTALAVVASISGAIMPVLAQQGLTQEAYQIQQGMATGAISPGQATRMAGEINQIQSQAAVDRSMNGGHLNGAEAQQIHAEMAGLNNQARHAAMSNGVNPYVANGMFSGSHGHHHQFGGVMSPYNQYPQQYPQQYQNMQYRSQLPYQGYPNNGYYGNGQQYYGNYQNGGYPNQYQNFNQQGGLSGAANMLKRLF